MAFIINDLAFKQTTSSAHASPPVPTGASLLTPLERFIVSFLFVGLLVCLLVCLFVFLFCSSSLPLCVTCWVWSACRTRFPSAAASRYNYKPFPPQPSIPQNYIMIYVLVKGQTLFQRGRGRMERQRQEVDHLSQKCVCRFTTVGRGEWRQEGI